MSDRTRNIVIVAVVLTCTLGINALALLAGSSTKDLTDVLSRRSPITDYNVATAEATKCRQQYQAVKDQHQARFLGIALDPPTERPTAEVLAELRTEIAADEQAFIHADDLCPYPVPPKFTPAGQLLEEPVIFPLTPPETTTSTTTQPGG